MKILMLLMLKLVEAAAIVLIPYWIGGWEFLGFEYLIDYDNKLERWALGLMAIIVVGGVLVAVALVTILLIVANLELLRFLGF